MEEVVKELNDQLKSLTLYPSRVSNAAKFKSKIDIVEARKITQKKLNDTTTLSGQHLCCSPNIDTVGASHTTQKKLNATTPSGQHLCCYPNIDTVGASQTTQKKLNYNILQSTQLKNPPSTANIRPDGEDIDTFFTKHIDFYKTINDNFFSNLNVVN
ncbi:hypothetical protein J6590_074265 [Homalodisca vitripennis]|nr:hypothetical protein J6590_074265 [Homalodisca vitripennis]